MNEKYKNYIKLGKNTHKDKGRNSAEKKQQNKKTTKNNKNQSEQKKYKIKDDSFKERKKTRI